MIEMFPELAVLRASSNRLQVLNTSKAEQQMFLLSLLAKHQTLCVIVPNQKEAHEWLQFFECNIGTQSSLATLALLPYTSFWGNDRYIQNAVFVRQRIFALTQLYRAKSSKSRVVLVTTLHGLLQKTFEPKELEDKTINLAPGVVIDQDNLISHLKDCGYIQEDSVEEEGSFGVRGAVFDVFSPGHEFPARLEFQGDTIVSMRAFDPVNQRSNKAIKSYFVTPTFEAIMNRNDYANAAQVIYDKLLNQNVSPADREGLTSSLLNGYRPKIIEMFLPLFRNNNACGFSYLDENSAIVFPKGIDACLFALRTFLEEAMNSHKHNLQEGRITYSPEFHFDSDASLSIEAHSGFCVEFGNPVARRGFTQIERKDATISNLFPSIPKINGSLTFDLWAQWISEHVNSINIVILSPQREQFDRIIQLLRGRNIDSSPLDLALGELLAGHSKIDIWGRVGLVVGGIDQYFYMQVRNILFISQEHLLGSNPKASRRSSKRLQNYLNSFKDLKIGDLVVHATHGIARYRGLRNLTVGQLNADFLVLEYDGNDKIYLPVDRLSQLQRYSADNPNAHVDRLGSNQWEKKKERVKKSILDMAERLISLQAKRESMLYQSYSKPSESYFKFEEDFPFEETEDQRKAIQDVNNDLSSGKAMDRLICGDVGFGKTEVALRAAMRVVSDGKQVLVLVPTTVLCFQHFRTFQSRFSKFGYNVAQTNRFIEKKVVEDSLNAFASGSLDILIGTHRLLTDKLKPRSLGLLIIDEEQKFGVIHKERIKELRANADILTLTATPIPRTLHMSMLGLRDISIIATAPESRLPVKTYIAGVDEHLIKSAIERELSRNGQVFYVYNHVKDIDQTLAWLKSLLPAANIRIAHGQMPDQELETVIIDFIEQKFQILLCTTIIESGIDMPNVNTLIVQNADHFGLSQLYQIRGRVGRSTQQAYAYFLVSNQQSMTEDARRRLEVLAAHQDLGSGFHIASYDLEIRGAGNLLGSEQSGQIAEVGLELYTEMLQQAVSELRGQKIETRIDTEFKIPVVAVIPESYIASESVRLQTYKNIFNSETEDDLIQIKIDLADRYGELPISCLVLFLVATAKQLLAKIQALSITSSQSCGSYEIKLHKLSQEQADKVINSTLEDPKLFRLTPDYRLFIYAKTDFSSGPLQIQSIDSLITALRRLTV